jgi:hypothetical protein
MLLGLAGWILPFIPGAPIFFLGLAMCISWHPRGRLAANKAKAACKNLATRIGLWPKRKADLTEELFRPDTTQRPPQQIRP